MKRFNPCFYCIFMALFLGATELSFSQDLNENSADSAFGLVYFLRGKGFEGSAVAFSALIDGERVCKLNNRRYSSHQVEPGRHEFSAQFAGKSGKKKAEKAVIDIEAGGTYYIQMIMQSSFVTNDVSAQEITRNSAVRLLDDDKIQLDPNCGDEE